MYASTSSNARTKSSYSIDSFAEGYSSRAQNHLSEVSDDYPVIGRLNPGAKEFILKKPSASSSTTGTSEESLLNLSGPTPRLNLTELLRPMSNLHLQQQDIGHTFDPRHEQEDQAHHRAPTVSQKVHQESMNFLERLDLKSLLKSQPPNFTSFSRPLDPSQDHNTHQNIEEENRTFIYDAPDADPAVKSKKHQDNPQAPTKKNYDTIFAHLESLYGTRKPEPRKAPKDIFDRLSNPIMGHTSTLEARKKLLEAQNSQRQEDKAPPITSRSTKNSKKSQAKISSEKKRKHQQNNQAEDEQQQQRKQKHDEQVAAAFAAVAETLKTSASSIEARKTALKNKMKSKPHGKQISEDEDDANEDEHQPVTSGFFLTQHEAQEESLSKKIQRLPSQAPPHALASSTPVVRKASRLNLAIAEGQQQPQQEQLQSEKKEVKAEVAPTRPTTSRTGKVSSRLKDASKSAIKRPIARKFAPKKVSSNEKEVSASITENLGAPTPAKCKSLLNSQADPSTPKTKKTPKIPKAVKVSKNITKVPTSYALLMGDSNPSKKISYVKDFLASSGSTTNVNGTKTSAHSKTQSSKVPLTRPVPATPSKITITTRKKLTTLTTHATSSVATSSSSSQKNDPSKRQQQQRKKVLPHLNSSSATTHKSFKRNTP
jgi:hypothetical protein